MWFFQEDDDEWIDFKPDKRYDWGEDSDIDESGIWELDIEQRYITLRDEDSKYPTKYRFEFDNSDLQLYSINGEREGILFKKE